MTTGEIIKQLRQTLGLTQSKFADPICISTSCAAEMELGNKNVNDRTIRLISTEWGFDYHWLRARAKELCIMKRQRLASKK